MKRNRFLSTAMLIIFCVLTFLVVLPGNVFAAVGDVYQRTDNLYDGQEYMFVSSNYQNTPYALSRNNNTVGATQVTLTGQTITWGSNNNYSNAVWRVEVNNGRYALYHINSGAYLGATANNVTFQNTPFYWDHTQNDFTTNIGGTLYYLRFTGKNNTFVLGTSSSTYPYYFYIKQVSAPEGISIEPTATISEGGTAQLNPTFTPAGTFGEINWVVADPTVAKVDESGTITGLKAGTTTVKATVNGTESNLCEVTVSAATKYIIAMDDYALAGARGEPVHVNYNTNNNQRQIYNGLLGVQYDPSAPTDDILWIITPVTGTTNGYYIKSQDGQYLNATAATSYWQSTYTLQLSDTPDVWTLSSGSLDNIITSSRLQSANAGGSALMHFVRDGASNNIFTVNNGGAAPEIDVFYGVTFNLHNGEGIIVETVKSGEAVTKPSDPTLEGWDFKGWSTEEEPDSWNKADSFDFSTPITANTELHAIWGKTITVNGAEGMKVTIDGTDYTSGNPIDIVIYDFESDQDLTIEQAAVESGYIFKGWSILKPGDTEPTIDESSTLSLPLADLPNGTQITLKAEKPYNVWVGEIQVTSANRDNILNEVKDGTATAVYDPDTQTLTLNNPTITGEHGNALIDSQVALTIKGSAELDATGKTYGIYAYPGSGALTIEGDITVTGASYGMYSRFNLVVNSGTVNVTAVDRGMYTSATADIVINGGDVTVTTTGSGSACLYSNGRGVVITGGTLTTETTSGNSYGIRASSTIDISGGTVNASGSSSGIYSLNGPIHFSGSETVVNAKGNSAVEIVQYDRGQISIDSPLSIVNPVGGYISSNKSYIATVQGWAANDVTIKAAFSVTAATAENGTVSVDRAVAGVGDTVNVTTEPADGYVTDTVTYTTSSGDSQTISMENNAGSFSMPASNVTVSATFKAIDYNVTVAEGMENGGAQVSKETANIGDVITITPQPDAGYEVDTVTYTAAGESTPTTVNPTDGVYSFTMPAADVTVSATFKAIDYTVSFDPEMAHGHGLVGKEFAGSEILTTAHVGDTIKVVGYPDKGYVVDTVTAKDSSGGDITIGTGEYEHVKIFTMPADNVTVYISFKLKDYTVEVYRPQNPDGGVGVGDLVVNIGDTVGTYDTPITDAHMGDTVTVTATPNEGYKINRVLYQDDLATSEPVDIEMTENGDGTFTGSFEVSGDSVNRVSVGAIYEPIAFTVKFDSNGGTGTMSDQGFVYGGLDQNSKLLNENTFTRKCYTFTGWNTEADGNGTAYEDKADVSKITTTDGDEITLYAQWEGPDHSWGEPTYEWSDDNSSVTAKRVCANDPKHIETETAATTLVTVNATCTAAGSKTWTSAAFANEAFAVQSKTEVISALGHNMTEHAAVNATCTEPGNSAYWSCDKCGKYFSDAEGTTAIEADSWVIEATGHNMTEHAAVNATCTEPGNSAYWSCDKCGKYFSDAEGTTAIEADSWVIEATGHNMTEHAAVNATCTEPGNSAYWSCDKCGKYFSDAEGTTAIEADSWVIEATGHNMTEHAAVNATCTEPGNSAYWSCDKCGKYFSDAEGTTAIEADSWVIEATGHNMTEHAAVNATCTEPGNSAYWSCDKCGKYFSDAEGTTAIEADSWVIEATGHNMTEHAAVNATCTEPGNSAYWSCDKCGKYFSDAEGTTAIEADSWVIEATGHNMTEHAAVNATCTEDGNSAYWSCDKCGKYFSDAEGTTAIEADSWVIEATGHNMTEHAAVNATCTEPGNSAYWSCDKCGKYFSDAEGTTAIEADSWVIEATGHNLTEHPEVRATCTEDGNSAYWSCDKCGKYFSDAEGTTAIEADSWVIEATGHNMTEHPEVRATCTEDGNSAYWSCDKCGKYFSDAEGTTAIEADSWVIEATGHNWGAPEWTWADDHSTASATFTCQNDSTHTETVENAEVTSTTTEPTPTEDGLITYTATVTGPDGKPYNDIRKVVIPAAGFNIIVNETKNGSASADKDTAQPGEEVTITVTPDQGYQLSKITYTTASGTPTDITKDKSFIMPASDVTVDVTFAQSGGGGGGVTPAENKITIEDPVNGSVDLSKDKAAKGDVVVITPTPDEGYETGDVTVTGKDGKEIPVQDNGDGTYSFTMPDGPVSVDVTFNEVDDGGYEPDCPSKNFKDFDPNAWYHESVDYVVVKGLMNGIAADKFAPNDTTTRAMLVTILYRLEGKPAVSAENPFDDVADGQWYTDAVLWANANGIVKGYGNGKFGPMDDITREQFATIIYRYANYKGYDTSKAADLSGYEDASSIGSWAQDAMKWANAEGLITGRTATTLVPTGDATRAEAAAILMRFCETIG